jgi:hypothetical protein
MQPEAVSVIMHFNHREEISPCAWARSMALLPACANSFRRFVLAAQEMWKCEILLSVDTAFADCCFYLCLAMVNLVSFVLLGHIIEWMLRAFERF